MGSAVRTRHRPLFALWGKSCALCPWGLSAFLCFGVSALAQDMDDDAASPRPPATAQADDAKFAAYGQPVIAFTHAEIVDGTGAAPKYDQTLVIDHGRIAASGDSARLSTPAGATIIDAHGKTLLPGFVMVHEHL